MVPICLNVFTMYNLSLEYFSLGLGNSGLKMLGGFWNEAFSFFTHSSDTVKLVEFEHPEKIHNSNKQLQLFPTTFLRCGSLSRL